MACSLYDTMVCMIRFSFPAGEHPAEVQRRCYESNFLTYKLSLLLAAGRGPCKGATQVLGMNEDFLVGS